MRGIRWIELVDVQQRAMNGVVTPEDVIRLAGEVLRAWDQLTPALTPRTVTWIDVVEVQANALDGVASADDVMRLANEIHRCWDRLYPLALRPAEARVNDVQWRFAGMPTRETRPTPLRRLGRAVKETTGRLRRSVVVAMRRFAAA